MSDKPQVRLRPSDYQPKKAELEDDVNIPASPEDMIRAAFRQSEVIIDPKA